MSQLNAMTTVIDVVCWPTFTGNCLMCVCVSVFLAFFFISVCLFIDHCFFLLLSCCHLCWCFAILLFLLLLFSSTAASRLEDCYLWVILVFPAMNYKSTAISHLFILTCIAVFLPNVYNFFNHSYIGKGRQFEPFCGSIGLISRTQL